MNTESPRDELETELLPKILWEVYQNGKWFVSPILDKDKKVLPKEKLAEYGMDVQEASHHIMSLFDTYLDQQIAEELSRLAVDDDEQIFVCYFDDDGDCKRDVSLTDRIAQLTNKDKR